ncbi:MAG: hypothetical protein KDJ70_19965, partial [Candidatus Competibacteraceae bacterium]|nr:hypothetical protein [Candidatus Competibacteraceae bacterium]
MWAPVPVVRVVVRGKAFWDLVEAGIETLQRCGDGRFLPRRHYCLEIFGTARPNRLRSCTKTNTLILLYYFDK